MGGRGHGHATVTALVESSLLLQLSLSLSPLSLSLAAILFAFRRALIISDAMLFRLRWVYPFVDAIFHSGKIDIIFSLEFSAKFVRMRFGELDTALRLEEVRLRDHAT